MMAKTIGAYKKGKELGRGTYGTVYEGIHYETNERVAIKKIYGKVDAGEAEAKFLQSCNDASHVLQVGITYIPFVVQ